MSNRGSALTFLTSCFFSPYSKFKLVALPVSEVYGGKKVYVFKKKSLGGPKGINISAHRWEELKPLGSSLSPTPSLT